MWTYLQFCKALSRDDTAIFLSYLKKRYKTLFSITGFFLTDPSISLITLQVTKTGLSNRWSSLSGKPSTVYVRIKRSLKNNGERSWLKLPTWSTVGPSTQVPKTSERNHLPHRLSKRKSLSTTTVLFRTTFTRTIKLNLRLKALHVRFLGKPVSFVFPRVLFSRDKVKGNIRTLGKTKLTVSLGIWH